MRLPSLGLLAGAVEHMRQKSLKPLGLQQALLDVVGDESVELVHWNSAARTASLALAGFGAAGVVTVAAALAGAERHCTSASGTEADAGKERGTADDRRRRDRRAAAPEQHLDGLELGNLDNGRHRHLDDFGLRFALAGLPELGVEAVATDIGGPGQHLVDGIHTPAPAVAGPDARCVEMRGDGLDALRSAASVALAREAKDQAYRLGLNGVDLKRPLGSMAALPLLAVSDSI